MPLTIDQLFYGAYRDAGLVLLEQTGLNPDQTEEARQIYNRMADAWALDGLTISHVARTLFPITPSVGDYTVGPSGDWDTPYPTRVERASVILTNQSPSVERPLIPLTLGEWQEWRLKQQTTNWPLWFFYEPSFPLGIMHLLFVPTDGNQIALYLEEKLIRIDATGDTLLSFRDGYEDAITSNLAVRIASRTPGSNISADVKELARSSLHLVKMANNRPLKRSSDMEKRGGRSNVYAGSRYWNR